MSKKKKKEKDEEVKKPKATKKAPAPAGVEPATKPKTRAKPKAASTPRKAKAVAPSVKIGFSTEEIALRAYFIAEDRQRHGKPGTESGDWHEAERQLRAEALAKSAKKSA